MKVNLIVVTLIVICLLMTVISRAQDDTTFSGYTISLDTSTYTHATSFKQILEYGWDNIIFPLFENAFPVVTFQDELMIKYDIKKIATLDKKNDKYLVFVGPLIKPDIDNIIDKIGPEVSVNYFNEKTRTADFNYTGGVGVVWQIKDFNIEKEQWKIFLGAKWYFK